MMTVIWCFLFLSTANAQVDQKVEKLEVTGSHIKRVDVEGPSPVQVIDREALDKTGYNSVSDVLRDIGANSFGSFREHGGMQGGGLATVNLRGVGEQRTLVLLNGKRMPANAINGAVDLNLIPMAAVERVEVLKDSASSTYGSDALGGVVNIITKKDFEGNELSGSTSATELGGGNRHDLSWTYGLNTAKFNMINVVYFRNNTHIASKDRPWSHTGLSGYSNYGSYKLNKTVDPNANWKASPNCPGNLVQKIGSDSSLCRYNYGDHNFEMPDLYQGSVLNQMEYEINEDIKVFTRAGYTYKKTLWQLAPAFDGTLTMSAPKQLGSDFGKLVDVRYRYEELGNRVSDTDSNAYNVMVGTKGFIGETWDWELSSGYSRVEDIERRTHGYALKSDVQAKLNSGEFNPFAPKGQNGSLEGIGYTPSHTSISELSFAEFKTTGELGEFMAGPVGMAVGMMATREMFNDFLDERTMNGEVLQMAGSAGSGMRDTASIYSEVGIQMASSLETQLALRYDLFSDFGDTVNPKLGLRWKPLKSLMFRSSVGTGFRAPAMQDLYRAKVTGQAAPFIDQVACRAAGGAPSHRLCQPQKYNFTLVGNENLREETSFSTNVGAIFQPHRYHSFGVDSWYLKLDNLVSARSYEEVVMAEAAGVDISQLGASTDRHPITQELTDIGIYTPIQNTAAKELSGIDFNYQGSFNTKIGRLRLQMEHTLLIYFRETAYQGAPSINRLGQFEKPSWRNNAGITLAPTQNQEGSLFVRTIAEHEKIQAAAGKHPTYSELDVQYSYDFSKLGGRVTAGVRNILGTIAPIDDSDPGDLNVASTLYDERGRQFYLRYRQIF